MEKYKQLETCSVSLLETEERDRTAVDFFVREICEKTGITISIKNWDKNKEDETFSIVFSREERAAELPEAVQSHLKAMEETGEEGYRLCTLGECIYVLGHDALGLLFGAGRLLRILYLKHGVMGAPRCIPNISATPDSIMRGHQLAYRDKQNTTPAWTAAEFERYIRDLVIFGANSIELLPPRTDDNLFSSHFREDPMDMMAKLSEVIHSLGLTVSVWYPYLSESIEGDTFAREMAEREKVFVRVPFVDEMLIPAGDPGELRPKEMFRASGAAAAILHKYHPHAKIWIAPQVFAPDEAWYPEFYRELEKEPEWLYGVCFGPWEMDTIEELYEKVPEKYKKTIRHYPDISHNINSQFEIPDWDAAFASTSGRESYNARPYAMKAIHDKHNAYVIGSITYSEGIHDDFNKMHWGNMDFFHDVPVEESVRDYVRYFISPDCEEELTDIFLKLEKNWEGPAAENRHIDSLYQTMMELDAAVEADVKENYRYQMVLLRVIGDYQIKKRRIYDLSLEAEAYRILSRADQEGALVVMRQAAEVLLKSFTEPAGLKERYEMQRLADELYKKCGIQLTTSRHKGQDTERGAWLDTLFYPLNDAQWILKNFERISQMDGEKERLKAIHRLSDRCRQSEKVSYYFLGDFKEFSRVVRNIKWEYDPGMLRSPLMYHCSPLMAAQNQRRGWYDEEPVTEKWLHGARTLYGTPLEAVICGLNPDKKYSIAVTYQQILIRSHIDMKFWAGDKLIHTSVQRKFKDGEAWDPTYEYELPRAAYETGELRLKWQTYHVLVPCVVSELWLRETE